MEEDGRAERKRERDSGYHMGGTTDRDERDGGDSGGERDLDRRQVVLSLLLLLFYVFCLQQRKYI